MCDVEVGEGPWGFDVLDNQSDALPIPPEEYDNEGPEDALYRYSRPGSKQYIVSLSESVAWRCPSNINISRSRHINLLEAVAYRVML